MVHLIGVEHKVQRRKSTAQVSQTRKGNWELYSSAVKSAISKVRPSVVAEELNQELLDYYIKSESLLLSIKNDYELRTGARIKHIFAEPCSAQKKQIRIKEDCDVRRILKANGSHEPTDELVSAHMAAHQFPIREQFWIGMIWGHLNSGVLFVCGDAHIDTFPMLLDLKGIAYNVIQRGIGMPPDELIVSKGVKYAQEIGLFGTVDCPCQK